MMPELKDKKKLIGVPLSIMEDVKLLLEGKAFIIRKKGREFWEAHDRAELVMAEWGTVSAPLSPSLQERITTELLATRPDGGDSLREALDRARVTGVRVIVNDNGAWDGQKLQGMHTNGPCDYWVGLHCRSQVKARELCGYLVTALEAALAAKDGEQANKEGE